MQVRKSIKAVDFVLDRLYLKKQIMRSIPKIEINTKDDYNQTKRHLRHSR